MDLYFDFWFVGLFAICFEIFCFFLLVDCVLLVALRVFAVGLGAMRFTIFGVFGIG